MERKYRRRQCALNVEELYDVDGSVGWEISSLDELINDKHIGRLAEQCLRFLDSEHWCVVTGYRGFDRMIKAHIRIPDRINGKIVVGVGNPRSPAPVLYNGFDNENGEFTPLYNVVSIQIPNSVKFIVDDFVCPNLKDINIPKSLEYIGSYTFCGYNNPSVIIPGSVQVISDHAFANSKLQNVIIQEGVREIQEEVFGDSLFLNTITLPKSLEFIDATAFTHWRVGYGEYISYAAHSQLKLTNPAVIESAYRLCDALFFVPPDSYALRFVKSMDYKYEVLDT